MKAAHVTISPSNQIAPVNTRIFGSFVEHMGRCVYGGIFEPEHSSATPEGFRQDVIELTRELGVSVVRYPGGNFVSGYRWEDGVGPKEDRPTRLDLAWRSIETNQFGLNEFMHWIDHVDAEPMMAVNLGTRGVQDAADLVEYCNYPGVTHLTDLRKDHGVSEPHKINMWCLGNEMDGPWQIGHKTAQEYGRLAQETAKAIRLVDPDVTLVVCGSSYEEMPTFGSWERTVLDHTFEHVDLISLHAYYEKYGDDTASFLAASARMNRFIEGVVEAADEIAAKKGSEKKINLSFDEWNVWYQKRFQGVENLEWEHAPRLIEDEYTTEDAVVVGGLLMTLLNNSDRVAVACQAQLVNIIGPIRTEPDAPAWKQTIFHPFALMANGVSGNVLRPEVTCGTYDCELMRDVPLIDASSTYDASKGKLVVIVLNRSDKDDITTTFDLSQFKSFEVEQALQLGGSNLQLTNNVEFPNRVSPQSIDAPLEDQSLTLSLPPVSWTFVTLRELSRS
jgi:alpha-N-arabinofuranosidase